MAWWFKALLKSLCIVSSSMFVAAISILELNEFKDAFLW